MEKTAKQAQESIERAAETMGDTIVQVLDKLAGTKSDVKLSFQDLTFDAGIFKAKMNGAIVLDVTMAKEAEGSTSKASESAAYYPSS